MTHKKKLKKKPTTRTMNIEERNVLQEILVDYVENPRMMGTCIKNIESLFHVVHIRWNEEHSVNHIKTNNNLNNDAHKIISNVCSRYEITYKDLIGTSRTKCLLTAREQICDALYTAGYNYSQIGRAINRHASTVIHTLNKLKEQ